MSNDLHELIEALGNEPKAMTLEHDRLILRRKDEGTDARVVLVRCPHTIGLCFETDTPEPGWLGLLPCPCNDRSEVVADLVPRGETAPTVGWVHVTHADPEEHARIFNEGYEAAMAQHLADDPSAADDWLAARDAEVARAVGERIAAAIEALPCPGSPPAPLARYAFETAKEHAATIARAASEETR